MLAAGKNVEPFWRIYRQHYNSKLPIEILEPLRIGDLHPDDIKTQESTRDTSDPYYKDPAVSPVMKILQVFLLCVFNYLYSISSR